ncbi:MAG: Enoyl-CoA hydratase [Amycolatopsis sp.]|jgi:enoyl-CoA hydratase/carnithine racemase|uniref:enoyl-CoA hydratase/isomerase family protein n=1 Tax=Amycolatopsis sp. TaxID=37632 RepID=UPI00261B5779|nr:enoyl-CoA hydratase/isomerase family protein [Amycolatopsis sp.]MCU1680661.1 Enoyl-CoA hydratase [Amycolatopsis sp.]
MSHLTCSIEAGVAELVLTNPPQNRIDEQTADELVAAVETIGRSSARAVLVRAEGRDFCFGGDITTWSDLTNRQLRALFEKYLSAFNRLERLPLLVIAAVQGLCAGGGFELALRADIIFAGESARFAHPEQSLGLVTVLGGVQRVAARAGRARAAEWALTSDQVPAAVMADAGVVNHVVADDLLLSTARSFAVKIAAGPTRAHTAHKALLRAWEDGGVTAADNALFDIAMPLFESDDTRRGLTSATNALRAGVPRPSLDFTGN